MNSNKHIIMSNIELERGKIITECISKRYTTKQASNLLNLSCRHTYRMKLIVKKYGISGLAHKSRSKKSNRKIPDKIKKDIVKTIKEKYWDFGPTLACEKLIENHNIVYGKETIRQIMINNNLWKPKPRKKNQEYRIWRPRKENKGELVQYDGSYHNWFEDRLITKNLPCLLAAMDDATGEITYAKFDDSEGVIPTMKFWTEYFKINGKPVNIYLDRGSTYKNNNLNPNKIIPKEEELTQFQRACSEVNVNLIHAKSPQAKGRVERLFHTLQDRLTKEMRLNNINTIKQANDFLIEVFVPKFNKKFGVQPVSKIDFHKQLTINQLSNLYNSFCIKHKRKVMNDFTVRFDNVYYQILKDQKHRVLRKSNVVVKKHLDNTICLEHKGFDIKYTALIEKPLPEKKVTVSQIKKKMKKYTPPLDHPWRKPFNFSKNLKNTKTYSKQ